VTRRRAGGGFTLLETLVAITLLALLFGALMPVFQQGLSALSSADRHGRAVLLAQSLLEQASAGASSEGAAGEGEEGDYRWVLAREPFAADDGGPTTAEDGPLRLVRLSVTVTWPGGGEGVRLATLALEPAS
jgi:type II secretory pathway pseudopilin PulG